MSLLSSVNRQLPPAVISGQKLKGCEREDLGEVKMTSWKRRLKP